MAPIVAQHGDVAPEVAQPEGVSYAYTKTTKNEKKKL
jgi:hypothetical protein